MSSRIWDGPCPTCGKYSLDCTCGLFDSKENESMESHQERKELYELNSIRDERLHIQPYADMIDKLTYVQKADFAKRAIELERDCATYKKMFEEVSRERNAWVSEYGAARAEVERTKLDRDLFKTERDMWKNEVNRLTKILRRYDQEDDINDGI